MKTRSLLLAFFSTVIQYYDYALFGLSASVLAKAYIPSTYAIPNILSFFGILYFAVVMRPVGAIIFGKIGDQFGRSIVIKISVFIASISTLSVGLINPNQSITSAILLILARMLFMMTIAGQGDGVRIYVSEMLDKKREFMGNAIVTCSSQFGVLISSVMYALSCCNIYGEYLWRMNFIIGGIAGIILLFFQNFITETKEFIKFSKSKDVTDLAFRVLEHYKIITIGIFIMGGIGGIYTFYVIFYMSYVSAILDLVDKEYVSQIHIISIISYIVFTIISGYVADKYNPYNQVLVGLFCAGIFSIINAIFISYGSFSAIFFWLSIITIPFFTTPLQIMFKRLVPMEHRLRIFSLAHSFGSLLFSSSAAFIGCFLWNVTNIAFLPIIYIMLIIISVFVVTIFAFKNL